MAVFSLALACAPHLAAQTVYDWIDPSGGSYHDINNWSPLGVPNTTTESARFNVDARYNVTMNSGVNTIVDDLSVLDGVVNLAANAAVFATYTLI